MFTTTHNKQMIQCNLCTQSFDERDPDLFARVKRHEEFHLLPSTKLKNIVHGKVKWITNNNE